MNILVTNDDGIYAEGLWALVSALVPVGKVTVVAPDREQSGVGASISLHEPVRVQPVAPLVAGVEAWAVEGTPADSVIMALGYLAKDNINLVVSGINNGANLGNDVIISGTVGAAFQAYFRGLPAIALAVAALEKVHYQPAARLGQLLARKFAEKALPEDYLLNVNLPNLPLEKLKGISLTRLGRRAYAEEVAEGHDGKRPYYWIKRGRPDWKVERGTDIQAILQKRVSLTAIHGDLTRAVHSQGLRDLCHYLFQALHQG